MINQELLNFIKQNLAQGKDKESIKKILTSSGGWKESDIEEGFKNLNSISGVPMPDYVIHRKKKWKIILLLIILLPIIIGVIDYVLQPKVKNFDDSTLRIDRVSVQNYDNAYYDLQKLDSLVPKTQTTTNQPVGAGIKNVQFDPYKYFDNKNPDSSLIEKAKEYTTQSKSAFGILAQASTKPIYQILDENNFGSLTNFRKISRDSVIYADVIFREGQVKEALDLLFINLDLSKMIMSTPQPLILYLLALAVENQTLVEIQFIAESGKLSSLEKEIYGQKLAQYTDTKTGIKNAFKSEYNKRIIDLNIISKNGYFGGQYASGIYDGEKPKLSWYQNIADTLLKSSFFWNPIEAQKVSFEYYKQLIDSVDITNCGNETTIPPIKQFTLGEKLNPFNGNYLDKIIYSKIFASFNSTIKKSCDPIKYLEAIKKALI